MWRKILNWLDDNSASTAVQFGLMITPISFAIMAVLGLQQVQSSNQRIQVEIDAASITAAKVFIDLYSEDFAAKQQAATERVNLIEQRLKEQFPLFQNIQLAVELNETEKTAAVSATGLMVLMPRQAELEVNRSSMAVAMIENQPVCILALEPRRTAIEFAGQGEIKAKDCVVWSNSAGMQSIKFMGKGKVETERLCAVGRVGNPGQYKVEPEAEEGCELVNDPMSDWVGPTVGECDFEDYDEVAQSTLILRPGVYCGGLKIRAQKVKLMPGEYIVLDGPLEMRSEKEIKGDGVGIYLSGEDAWVSVESDAKIELNSMETGAMAGIAIAQDPSSNTRYDSTVTGRTDLKIGGVLYLPEHDLLYWGESDTRAASPVTTIIARTIKIGGKAYLEVKNDKNKAKYAPVLETGHGSVALIG